ncbi:HIT family protein [Kitasatospora cineracea]|uniref:Diadenosine tetraphosphate (Ap4A) HIT family hydrolase n=1 Tax=Kitasatospora cineracea TaxID=88074 RepID=A0A3N4SDN0_9ACTN|nr:HIT family protein [Kitasatospora cineracea]RPE34554.1 diadenosine tetraphosphate (Ap4A) HIT family hydrolase [Kitasatospora cineracea]
MSDGVECYACAREGEFERLPRYERIAVDEHWRVVHAVGCALPGWLVLLPRRHLESMAELSGAEAASLGVWQVRLARALEVVTGCRKAYVAQFGEAEGFAHVHFHVVPRGEDFPVEWRGPRVFGLLKAGERAVPVERMNELGERLAVVLEG